MDSDVEDLDYGEVGSEEEDLDNSSGGDGVEEVAEDSGNKEPDYAAVSRLEKHYKILKEEEIMKLQENDISRVSSVLSVSRGVACAVLCRNNWSLSSVYDEWFADDERASDPAGIQGKRKSCKQVCKICYEEIGNENMVSAACGHPFCADCWKTYITTSIKDGPGCLALRCPEPACKVTVGIDMVDRLVSGDEKDKYYRYLCRSYVECGRNRKWCPAPGCDLAIELDSGGCESYDMTCDCSHRFCWKCTEESHRPIDCDMVAKWLDKNSSEAENTTWILAYTKPCPKCKKPIEKNQGCNHMTCRSPCGFQFCWVCLGPWNEHGGVYSCNKYNAEGVSLDEKRKMKAKKHLEQHTHYYERWDSNDKSRKRALVDLNRSRNEYTDTLNRVQGDSHGHLKFVTEAWEQIVECRRVLKWTYAYGYYLSLEENSRNKINLFEYLQGQAEAALERLHHCVEMDMEKYLHSRREDFKDFRSRLAHLTAVTKNHFENLVRALENSLSEVESFGTNTCKSSKH